MVDASLPRRPIKRLGQNFLSDPKIAEEIVEAAQLNPSDIVLEPGPGLGVLTRLLARRAGQVIAIEKDAVLAKQLEEEFRHSNYDNVVIINGDILRIELPHFNKMVSTPPYYLSSKLILLLSKVKFERGSLVLQKEFAERLSARPGTSEYGRLSVLSNRYFSIENIRTVSRSAFNPRPKVDSALIILQRKEIESQVDELMFSNLVRGLFTQRRRLVRSALAHWLTIQTDRSKAKAKEILETINVPMKRVYELTPTELEKLTLELEPILTD